MYIKTQNTNEKFEAKKQWHRFFTILPRRISPSKIAFMEFIERKGVWGDCSSVEDPLKEGWIWKYRANQNNVTTEE